MRNIWTIAAREMRAPLETPVGWVVLSAWLLLTGLFFALATTQFSQQSLQVPYDPYLARNLDAHEYLIAPFFASSSILLLFICPALTMRLFAEELKSRSLELLLTSPITPTQMVLGKYLGVMGFSAFLLLSTLHYSFIFGMLTPPDWGVLVGCYLLLFLLMGAFNAIGLLISASTESPIVALLGGFGAAFGLWLMGLVDPNATEGWAGLVARASFLTHLEALTRGLIHLQDLVYYLGIIGAFLYATTCRVDAWRWR